MAFSAELADRVRHSLKGRSRIDEGTLLGGRSFWVDDRLVVSVHGDDLLLRVPLEDYPSLLDRPGVMPYEFAARAVPGWVLIEGSAVADDKALSEWVGRGLADG